MEFGVTGKATPRAYNRHIPGSSARGRPQSGKQSFNPITGEEMRTPTPVQQYTKVEPSQNGKNKSDNIPSLNLNYLKDDDLATGPAFDIDLNDYSLDSPGSVSTVSWGTARSTYGMKPQTPVKPNRQQTGVPGLELGLGTKPPSARKPTVKPISAWDNEAVPENLPAPSARHQQMYQQYAQEMKESYRAHADQNQKAKPKRREVNERLDESTQDTVKDSWTRQKYTGKQLIKKLDAEDLLEYNKKQKMVETVMVDQLSRAVISDPQQNVRSTYRDHSSSTRRERGSNRYLHDSRINTSSSATENLLSRRVRFGARILTRNAQDAMRELTGFYFDYDKTMTVYEFRKFGKSAKAMPFIYRGQYVHLSGPKQGKAYSLSDIYSGANLKIPTKGQLALTDSLAENDMIVLRVIDVDESEKDCLMEYDDEERDHAPSKLDIENRDFLSRVQEDVAGQVCKRGIKVVTGLGRFYRRLDQYNTGILDQFDLEKGIKTFRIKLDQDTLEEVFEILDPSGMKLLDYVEYMHGILGEMSEYRKALVRKAFKKLSSGNKGVIHVSDVKKFFNGNIRGSDPCVSALQAFLEAVREDDKNEYISFIEFEEYYEGLSLGLETDEDFANVLRNTWNV